MSNLNIVDLNYKIENFNGKQSTYVPHFLISKLVLIIFKPDQLFIIKIPRIETNRLY